MQYKRLIAALVVLGCSPAVLRAQTGEDLLLLPWEKDQIVESDTEALAYRSSHFNSTDSSSYFNEIESSGRWRLDTSRELNPTLGYDWTHIQSSGNTGIPGHLDDLSAAFATPVAASGDWFYAITAGGGYAGSNAFATNNAWYGKGAITAGTELNKDSALILFIDYDGNRTIFPDMPLPGFAYTNTIGENVDYVIGLPTSAITWRPLEHLKFEASAWLFTSVDASVEYTFAEHWKVYASYADRQTGFHTDELSDTRRLFYTERRLEAGVGYGVGDIVQVMAGVGYGFSRDFSTGFDVWNLTKITNLSDEPYVSLGLIIRY